jgi:hypothetical protein
MVIPTPCTSNVRGDTKANRMSIMLIGQEDNRTRLFWQSDMRFGLTPPLTLQPREARKDWN